MSGFLIDTNILSLLAPGRPPAKDNLSRWIAKHGDAGAVYISVITIAELERGLQKLKQNGATRKSEMIEGWIDTIQSQFADRFISIDANVARIAGQMDALAQSQGHNPGLADMLVAATAVSHDLVLATANKKHFEFLPLSVINPAE